MTANKETCEMLPCPLCGKQPDYQHFNVSQNTRGRIICACGLGLTQGRNDTEDGTILKWNTRSDHAVQAANERKAEQAIAATVGAEPNEATMLKLHGRMNAVLLDMQEELLVYHPQDRENASSKELIDCVIRAHQIIEDAAKAGARIEEASA